MVFFERSPLGHPSLQQLGTNNTHRKYLPAVLIPPFHSYSWPNRDPCSLHGEASTTLR